MKKLFYVVRVDGNNEYMASNFTESKLEAKTIRELKGGVEYGFYVRRGPDNIKSHTGVPRMRRKPKHCK